MDTLNSITSWKIRKLIKLVLRKQTKIEVLYDLIVKISNLHKLLQLREIRMNERGELFIIMDHGLSIFFAGSDGEIEYGDGQNLIYKTVNMNEVYPNLLALCLFTKIKSYVDIGANNGYYYSLQAAKYGIKEIHSFEPNPKILTHLHKNIYENNFQKVIKVYEIALSNLSPTTLSLAGNRGANSRIVQKKRMRDKILKVSTRKFDDLDLTLTSPTLIKIDVEGSELLVIQGAKDTIDRCRPSVQVEIVPKQCRLFGYDPQALYDFFAERDYVCVSAVRKPANKEQEGLFFGANIGMTHQQIPKYMDRLFVPREVHERTDYGAMAQTQNEFNTLFDFG